MVPSGPRFRGATASVNSDRSPNGRASRVAASSPTESSDNGYWPVIASRDEIPDWLRDNDYLLHGHPMPTGSYRRSYRLWRCLHMETMNIWTHLLASVAFIASGIALGTSTRESSPEKVLPGDAGVFGIFFAACAVAFGLSANFHTLRSHSYHIHHLWGRMDILGICMLAFGGGFSATYYAFYTSPTVRYVYWAVNGGAALAAAVTLFDTGGGGSKMRTLRGGVFSALTISAMLPVVHRNVQLGWEQGCHQIGTHYFVAEGATLVLGVCFFVGRIPERFWPGVFDVCGHSHQLWHICAAVGMAFHAMALQTGHQFHLRGDAIDKR